MSNHAREEELDIVLDRVERRWRTLGVFAPIRPSRREVDEWMRRRSVTDYETFARYLTTVGGMRSGEWDDDLLAFWPWSDIVARAHEFESSQGLTVPICDWSLDAEVYGLCWHGPGEPSVCEITGDAPLRIASSLHEFLARYLVDPGGLISREAPKAP